MKSILSVAALVISLGMSSSATAQTVHVVSGPEAHGGSPNYFYEKIQEFRQSGTQVELREFCASSCTLYTALMPDLVCAFPETRMVFHRLVYAEIDTIGETSDGNSVIQITRILGPVTGPEAEQFWMTLPLSVRKEVIRRSPRGLPRQGSELTIPANDLGIPTC